MLIAVLRAWFSRPEAGAPAWYRAHGDPVVGKALRMLHNNPAHPWTVATLAAGAGVSRAALARARKSLPCSAVLNDFTPLNVIVGEQGVGIALDSVSELGAALREADVGALRSRVAAARGRVTVEGQIGRIAALYRDVAGAGGGLRRTATAAG